MAVTTFRKKLPNLLRIDYGRRQWQSLRSGHVIPRVSKCNSALMNWLIAFRDN